MKEFTSRTGISCPQKVFLGTIKETTAVFYENVLRHISETKAGHSVIVIEQNQIKPEFLQQVLDTPTNHGHKKKLVYLYPKKTGEFNFSHVKT